MAQLLRTLLCKHDALSLNPSIYVQSQKCDTCNISQCCDQRQEDCWAFKDISPSPRMMINPISNE